MRRFVFTILFLCWSGPCWADMRATYRQLEGAGTIVIDVADKGDARLQVSGENWYLLVIKGKDYVVYDLPTGRIVALVAHLEQLMSERGLRVQLPPGFLR